MRYKPGQKQEMRKKTTDAVARAFRRRGYAGVGVDALAAEAGVTSGAIYSQFGSKDGAFLAALGAGMDVYLEAIPALQREHGANWLAALADQYLGAEHRADVAGGCTVATLVPDVIRAEAVAVREAFAARMTRMIDLVAHGLGGPAETRFVRALAFLATLVGGLNLARAMPTPAAGQAIADAVKRSALAAAGDVAAPE